MYVIVYIRTYVHTFGMTIVAILYSGKIPQKNISCDFVLKQTFCSINFTVCVLIVCVCALILTISQITFRELDQIAKNITFSPRENLPLYGTL